jgi:hypothetical protein
VRLPAFYFGNRLVRAVSKSMTFGLDHFRKEGTKLVPPPTGDDPYEDEAYRLWAIKQRGNVLI